MSDIFREELKWPWVGPRRVVLDCNEKEGAEQGFQLGGSEHCQPGGTYTAGREEVRAHT